MPRGDDPGVEDVCPYCGTTFTRKLRVQVTCGDAPCRNRHKWETTKRDPGQIARSRARNARWCAEHRSVRRRNPWLLGPPPYGSHLPGGGVELQVTPAPKYPIELRNTRGLHGMVTGLLGIPHHPTIPQFTLVPWNCQLRWGVYSQHEDVMRRIAAAEHRVRLFDRESVARCGPLVRVRAPVVTKRGRRRLRIDAVTPVLVRHGGASNKSIHTAPTSSNLHSTLDAWLPRRVGLASFHDDLPLVLIERHTQPETVAMGGKYGTTHGWVGHCIVETNAIGHWLLEAAARIGLGGRVALGFGRIRVTEC